MARLDFAKLPPEARAKYSFANNALRLVKIKNAEKDKYTGEPKDEINVIIGDDKQPDIFCPQVKLCRWTNEVNFSVRLKDNGYHLAEMGATRDKIKWAKGDSEIEFYDYDEGEGGYKMVWHLKKKPKSNVVEFSVSGKELNFFYQPPLTEEYQNGYSEEFGREIVVTEIQVKDSDGNVLVERPENVVGSYAVYHKTKGGLVNKNGKEYKAGKAFHIYRPKLIDAEGKEAWGKLSIDVEKGIYRVEIPQEFLDSAVYPIKSNDTFGYTSEGGTSSTTSQAKCLIGSTTRYTASTGDTITLISLLTNESYSGTGNVAIYDYNGSVPVNRLEDPADISLPGVYPKDWYDTSVLSWPLSNGITYGVAFVKGNLNNVYYDTGSGNETSNGALLSETWSHFSYLTAKYSIYATYTPSGGGGGDGRLNLLGVGQ